MAKLLTLDGIIEFEDPPAGDCLRERPAAALATPDDAERYAQETDNSDALPEN